MIKKDSGFSLIELMVTISVLAILVSIAIPSFSSAINRNRASSDVSGLTTAIAIARAEAIKRNGLVCVTSLDSSWNKGWQVRLVVDRSGNCSNLTDGSTTAVRVFPAPQSSANLTVKQGSTDVNAISFLASGARSGTSNYVLAYRAQATGCNTDTDRDLTIGATGRATVTVCTQ